MITLHNYIKNYKGSPRVIRQNQLNFIFACSAPRPFSIIKNDDDYYAIVKSINKSSYLTELQKDQLKMELWSNRVNGTEP